MTPQRLNEILERLRRGRIAVLGDFALDAWWHADMRISELSRETPYYTMPVVREEYGCGGASNVAENVRAIGVETVIALTVFGEDWRAGVLGGLLERAGVDTSRIIRDRRRFTITYGKPILHGFEAVQEAPRLDFNNRGHLPDGLRDELLGRLRTVCGEIDALIVQDQIANGVVDDTVRAELTKLTAAGTPEVVVVDSRFCIADYIGCITKPNNHELWEALHTTAATEPEGLEWMPAAAAELAARTGRPVFATCGPDGCVVADGRQTHRVPAPRVDGPIDTIGAGDACLAAAAAALAAGSDPAEAAAVATLAATTTVEQVGTTGTIRPDRMRELCERTNAQ